MLVVDLNDVTKNDVMQPTSRMHLHNLMLSYCWVFVYKAFQLCWCI